MAGLTDLCQQGAEPVHADVEWLAAPNPFELDRLCAVCRQPFRSDTEPDPDE